MNNTLLIISITAYILSIAACLILSIALGIVALTKLKIPLLIHTLILLAFAITYIINPQSSALHYLLLAFVCSGLVLSGIILRSDALLPMKIYFSVFLFSILLFIVSPSNLFRSISYSWKSNDMFPTFHISSNYFLEEQQALLNLNDEEVKYKVIQSFGIFHKTLARDLNFRHRLDSIHIISFNPLNTLTLQGYFSKKSATFEILDSLELTIPLSIETNKIIHKTSTSN